jgi:hypothetical protein
MPAAIEPFERFIDRLHSTATVNERAVRDFDFRADGAGQKQITDHLVGYYDGVEVVHSYVNQHGQILDCMPIDRQPASSIEGGATPEPPLPDEPEPGFEALMTAQRALDKDGNETRCPEGAVPILRLTLEEAAGFPDLEQFLRLGQRQKRKPRTSSAKPDDPTAAGSTHRYAVGYQNVPNFGGRSRNSVWTPTVQGPDIMSLSQIWCCAGQEGDNSLQTAEAGWQVYPVWYPASNGAPVFFIFRTADNYGANSAYNNRDGLFKYLNGPTPGVTLGGSSVMNGAQADIDVSYIFSAGVWWLYVAGVKCGYWLAAGYGNGPMSDGAQQVMFGGETDGNGHYPAMGSGSPPAGGYRHAAYHCEIRYIDANQQVQNANLVPIEPTSGEYLTSLQKAAAAPGGNWGSYFYFGGPGGA